MPSPSGLNTTSYTRHTHPLNAPMRTRFVFLMPCNRITLYSVSQSRHHNSRFSIPQAPYHPLLRPQSLLRKPLVRQLDRLRTTCVIELDPSRTVAQKLLPSHILAPEYLSNWNLMPPHLKPLGHEERLDLGRKWRRRRRLVCRGCGVELVHVEVDGADLRRGRRKRSKPKRNTRHQIACVR